MKLLFDENLSPRLCVALRDVFPDSAHVRDLGLERAPDADIWTYPSRNGFAIVPKDADFRQRSFLYGQPPKVVWIALGNCSTRAIERELRHRATDLAEFFSDEQEAFLVLS